MDNNLNIIIDDLNPQENPGQGDNGNPTQVNNDPMLNELEALFGNPEDDNLDSGRKQNSPDGQVSPEMDDSRFFSEANKTVQKLQSERDKLRAEFEKVKPKLQEYDALSNFLSQLQDDKEVRLAFFSELEPDLVKPKDALAFVKEELKKEFGEFTPDPHEAGVFGSDTWRYNNRAQELLVEHKSKYTVPSTVKDLAKKRKEAKERLQKEALAERQELVNKLKWDESTLEGFSKWVGSLKPLHLGYLYNKIMQTSQRGRVPFLANAGGGTTLTPNNYESELDKMFGSRLN